MSTEASTPTTPLISTTTTSESSQQQQNHRGIRRHDSTFSVSSEYYSDPSSNDLGIWQGAALLTADCLGTGLLALPHDVHVLGTMVGLGFLIINLPINYYAGTILSMTAQHVEEEQQNEDILYQQQKQQQKQQEEQHQQQQQQQQHHRDDDPLSISSIEVVMDDNNNNNDEIVTASPPTTTTYNSVKEYENENENEDTSNNLSTHPRLLSRNNSILQAGNYGHNHLHHDTATFDFIGMAQVLFHHPVATRLVMAFFYTNIFLVLGNYILVMSHAVRAMFSEQICIPQAGLISSIMMFGVVAQMRTMAKLGRSASIISLLALFIVVVQCLVAVAVMERGNDNNNDNINTTMIEGEEQERILLWNSTSHHHSMEEVERLLLESTSSSTTYYEELFRKFSALGSIGFAVGSQKLLLNIRHELQDRSVAPQCLGISLSAYGTFYVLIVLASGNNPPGFLFDSIPAYSWNRKLAGLFLWIHVVVSYAINSQAICSSMDRLFFSAAAASTTTTDDTTTTMKDDSKRWMMISGTMAVLAFIVANAIPFFKDLVALTGALTSVPLTLLLPAIFYRKYIRVPIWLLKRIITTSNTTARATMRNNSSIILKDASSYGLLLFSMLFMMAALMGVLWSIEKDWSQHGPPFSCT